MITAIIPAHDEASGVDRTVASLRGQAHPPGRLLVMADDSTDGTVETALRAGSEVLLTVDNAHGRAGALNQALESVQLGAEDLVLVLDAGAELPAGFLEHGLAALGDRNVGAVAAPGGTAALVRWRALQDVHRAFGRYYDEGPVTGQVRLALDLETVGWRLPAPAGRPSEGAASGGASFEGAAPGGAPTAGTTSPARTPSPVPHTAGTVAVR